MALSRLESINLKHFENVQIRQIVEIKRKLNNFQGTSKNN